MHLILVRYELQRERTFGVLFTRGSLIWHTLEDTVRESKVQGKTAIPAGRYKVVLSMSNRFKKLMPEVLNVPNFSGIRIHAGTTEADTDGCILVGNARADDRIVNSQLAFTALMACMQTSGTEHTLEILNGR